MSSQFFLFDFVFKTIEVLGVEKKTLLTMYQWDFILQEISYKSKILEFKILFIDLKLIFILS